MSYVDKNRYQQRWEITINGRTKEAVKKAMSKVTAPTLGFGLLRMEDIYSTSSASTKIEDRKEGDKMRESEVTGYSEEGCCETTAAGYEPRTVYEAKVETGDKILFMFYHATRASHIQIKRSDVSDSGWLDYLLIPNVDLHYHAPNGVWILHTSPECNPTWLFKVGTAVKKGLFYTPIITRVSDKAVVHSVVHETPYGGRHYDMGIGDDIVEGKPTTAAGLKKAVDWYEKAKKEEVKGKMRGLYHVILFNRKTEEIDYKAYVSAKGEIEAGMTAAHNFDKYDGKIHQHIVKHISSYDVIE